MTTHFLNLTKKVRTLIGIFIMKLSYAFLLAIALLSPIAIASEEVVVDCQVLSVNREEVSVQCDKSMLKIPVDSWSSIPSWGKAVPSSGQTLKAIEENGRLRSAHPYDVQKLECPDGCCDRQSVN